MIKGSVSLAALNVLVWLLSFAPVFYVVFWMGKSGWWFCLSVVMVFVGTQWASKVND